MLRTVPLLLVLLLAVSCTDDGGTASETTASTSASTSTSASASGRSPGGTATPTSTTIAPSDPDLDGVRARLERVAFLDEPTDLAVRPGDETLYVLERSGRVRAIDDGGLDGEPRLDISEEVTTEGEGGLLGLAFSPDGQDAYLDWVGRDGMVHVTRFRVDEGGRFDPEARRQILAIENPSVLHNGGDLAFGPDGHLYVAVGYGADDFDEADRAQRLDTLLGKILRIHPNPRGEQPYSIPSDNPFVGRPDARSEIWILGLRNPWRFSIDAPTGDLWVGDVGQFVWEEIDWLPPGRQAGANLGWARLEGNHTFRGRPPPERHVPPLFEYDHDEGGCAVTGGFVYRGDAIPRLAGAYVFADLCRERIFALTHVDGERVRVHELADGLPSQVAFGRDHAGELYVLSFGNGVFRLVPDDAPRARDR